MASQAASLAPIPERELAESPAGLAFVAAFKQQHPAWADREDKYIGRYGARLCLSDLKDGRQVALSRVPSRFEQTDGKPSAVEAEQILNLAIQMLCPDKAGVA
ncbi:hypothetical protein AB1484_34485 [Parafrankia sp. FMc6]|uniref:hypothetical protein n=1 Tax=Parafrankia soli TaxID=2599596 RepID=UPI0034D738D6